MCLTDYNQIKELLARHDFRFSKSLGQNFLTASWVPEEIAGSAGLDAGTGVLEIGPGIGCLTEQLSRRAGRVVAVELDRALMPLLSETLSGCDNTVVVFGDILRTDLEKIVREDLAGLRPVVCANLPYNVTSPVLTRLVTSRLFESVTVMIQREVAGRICAGAGEKDYSSFGILMQWYMDTEKLFDVPPSCFVPQPKVTSSVIRMTRREKPPADVRDEKLMFSIVRAAFNQRRKTLANAVSSNVPGIDKARAEEALAACGLDPMARGETLSAAQFAAFSDALS